MESRFGALHFSTVLPGKAFQRISRRLDSEGVEVVYDLEDTHWDPLDERRTAERREAARLNLQELVRGRVKKTGENYGINFSVRINGIGTNDAQKDVCALAELRIPFRSLVLPKVCSASCLLTFLEIAKGYGLRFQEIIPILESRQALEGVGELLEELSDSRDSRVRRVMFGAFDYCLDCGIWPFLQQNTFEFWSLVKNLVGEIERRGFEYVHTPFQRVNDSGTFETIVFRLLGICERQFWMSTMTRGQLAALTVVAHCVESGCGDSIRAAREEFADGGIDGLALAAEAVHTYESSTRDPRTGRDHGFVLDVRTGWFISPHEYLAAKRYLDTQWAS